VLFDGDTEVARTEGLGTAQAIADWAEGHK
jgi:hypothetical protein